MTSTEIAGPGAESVGIIAILRGISPEESVVALNSLTNGGITTIEVPLNSPDPLESIQRMRGAAAEGTVVGAGTVTTVQAVKESHAAGAQIIVAPNMDPDVIRAARRMGMQAYPGVASPTEAFAAIQAGATGIKIFPCDTIGTSGLKAWMSVLPKGTATIPVGGVSAANLRTWTDVGAVGAGIGGSLYRAGDDVGATLHNKALELSAAWAAAVSS